MCKQIKTKFVSDIKFYTKTIGVEDDIHALKTLVFIYSAWRTASGDAKRPLSEKHITLMAIYLKYGYNNDANKRASEFLSINSMTIDNMNHKLKDAGYLVDDKFNGRNKFISQSLMNLKDNFDASTKGKRPMLFIIKLSEK